MRFRTISIRDDESKSFGLDVYGRFTGVTSEHALTALGIKVEETDRMAVIWAQDHFDKAIELGRNFYQAGVLTLGVFPKYIDEQGCFDAQAINDGKSILAIVRALTAPAIYTGPISFDFNDIRTTLKDAGKFYAGFVCGADVDGLISKVTDKFQCIDLSKVESACINLYGESLPVFRACGTEKVKALLKMMPDGSSVHFGMHRLPNSFTCIPVEMKFEEAFGISFILAGLW